MNLRDYQRFVGSLSDMTPRQLEDLATRIRGLEYSQYRDDDSPKGENVPGVRHRAAPAWAGWLAIGFVAGAVAERSRPRPSFLMMLIHSIRRRHY